MVVLARAPFLTVLAGLIAMLALSERVVPWALPLVAVLVTCGVTASSYHVELKGQWRVAACVLVLEFLFSSWIAYSLTRPPVIPSFVKTTGTVVESRPWGRLYAIAVKTPQGGFVLRLPFATLVEGDRIRLEGTPKPFRSSSASGDFREDRFWYARGMTAQLTSVKTEPLPDRGRSFEIPIHRWRYGLYRAFALHFPQLMGAYLNAVWTGERDLNLETAHRAWGTTHLLSVSGFHVGVVMMAASALFKRGKKRVFVLSFVLWFYIFLTGAPSSAIRAGLMIQIALLGELAGRPASAINSVSLAAVLLLSHSPFWFWDIGWRLSVLAALTIAALLERSDPKDWRAWLILSPLIWVVTFPQVSWTFDSVPLAGVLINFVASSFFSVAMTAASLVALLRLAGVPGMVFTSGVLEGALRLWGIIADWVARLVPWQLSWSPYLAYCCTGIFIALLCRSLFVPWRNTVVLAPLGALASFALFGAGVS
jgi:competence protein ComEC